MGKIQARHEPEVPLGCAKWDGGTKAVACPHKERTKVESMCSPGKAKMSTGSKSIAWLSKQGSETNQHAAEEAQGEVNAPSPQNQRVKVESMGVPGNLRIRYMQQVRSMPR